MGSRKYFSLGVGELMGSWYRDDARELEALGVEAGVAESGVDFLLSEPGATFVLFAPRILAMRSWRPIIGM